MRHFIPSGEGMMPGLQQQVASALHYSIKQK